MADDSNWGRPYGQQQDRGRDDGRRRDRDQEFGRGAWPSEDRGGYGQEAAYGYGREGQQGRFRDEDRRRDYGYGREGSEERHGRPTGYGYGRQGDEYRPGPYGQNTGNGFGQRSDQNRDERRGDRDFFDRATDEVQSWFGDDDAERRRRMDDRRGNGDSWHLGSGEFRGRGPRNYTRSDERVRDDVNDRLSDDAHVDASDIEVTVAEGEVTLGGQVQNRFAKRHAEDIAERVLGVRHVQNNLRVRNPADRAGEGNMARTDATGGASTTGGSFGAAVRRTV